MLVFMRQAKFKSVAFIAIALALIAACGGSFVQQADAAVTTYTSRTVFTAAGGDPNAHTFAATSTTPQFFSAPIVQNGVTFTDAADGIEVSPYANSFYTIPSISNNRSTTLTITLPAGTTSFGFDAGEYYNGDSSSYSVVADGATLSGTVASGRTAFVGFADPGSFTTVTATFTGEYSLNNFTATPTAVPEPASLAVIGIPAAMALLRRRRTAI
jgi:hypothetical protein